MEAKSSQLAHIVRQPSSTLRLLIDGRKLGDGGIGVYIENLVLGVLATGGCDVTLIASKEQSASVCFKNEVQWIYDATRPYSLSELLLLSRRIPFARYDIFHTPHYVLPYGIPIPTVVTVHDLIHIQQPERVYYPFIARGLISSAVSRASAVIAVSRDTQRALISTIGADPSKLVHIPNAISPSLESKRGSSGAPPLPATSPYFLTVLSNLKPHKGFSDLLQAWQRFQSKGTDSDSQAKNFELVVAGYGAEMIRSSPALQRQARLVPGVRIIGAVENSALRHLYRWAQALIVPSLHEGFCLPALEAQACGTPVICRPVPAIKELITENDLVASDFSIEALEAVLRDGSERERAACGVISSHLQRFSIETVGEDLCGLYARVAQRGSQS